MRSLGTGGRTLLPTCTTLPGLFRVSEEDGQPQTRFPTSVREQVPSQPTAGHGQLLLLTAKLEPDEGQGLPERENSHQLFLHFPLNSNSAQVLIQTPPQNRIFYKSVKEKQWSIH